MVNKYIQDFNKTKYTYHALIRVPDIKVPIIIHKNLDLFSTSELMKMALENAIKEGGRKANTINKTNSFYINDRYGNSIRVSREGLTHSKRRKMDARRNLIVNFSSVFKNAVKVNEAYRFNKYSSIYFAEYIYGSIPYIARFIIINDSIDDIDIFSLYSLGTNKKEINASASKGQELISKISVKQLLNDVNMIHSYRDSLPLDVLYKINGKNYKMRYVDIQGLKY